MIKLNNEYSDYTDETDPAYPNGKAVDCSTDESYDGTPILQTLINDVKGALESVVYEAEQSLEGVSGVPDNIEASDFLNALKKLISTPDAEHAALRGSDAHGGTVAATAGQLMVRDSAGRAKAAAPSADDDLVTKKWADDALDLKTNKDLSNVTGVLDETKGGTGVNTVASLISKIRGYFSSGTGTSYNSTNGKVSVIYGNAAETACQGNDSRLSDTRTPKSHASADTTYGVSSATNYGHAKASSTSPKANGTASVGTETSSFARGDHAHPLQTSVSGNAGTATTLQTARNVDGKSFNGGANITHVCTVSSTANNTMTLTALDGTFTVANGCRIEVYFANDYSYGSTKRATETSSSATVDGNKVTVTTGAKFKIGDNTANIRVGGECAGEGFARAGDVHQFVYYNNSWNDVTADVIYKGGDSTNGYYEKKRNGLIEQWGILSIPQNTDTFTISLMISYSNSSYSILLQSSMIGETGTGYNQYWNSQRIQSKNENSYSGHLAGGNTTTLNYLTIGY